MGLRVQHMAVVASGIIIYLKPVPGEHIVVKTWTGMVVSNWEVRDRLLLKRSCCVGLWTQGSDMQGLIGSRLVTSTTDRTKNSP